MFNLDILILILLIIFSIMVLLTVIYLLLPQLFNVFVSPRFNGSYLYRSKDFKKNLIKEQLPEQEQKFKIDFNNTLGTYSILFGDKRNLINGIIKIKYKLNEYSNQVSSKNDSKLLELITTTENTGNDKLGAFKSYCSQFRLKGENKHINASIKNYNEQGFILFELTIPEGLENTSSGEQSELITSFPSFINKSLNNNTFTYRNTKFCPPTRKLTSTSAPVLFYDNDLNCLIISPLEGFLNTLISKGKNGSIDCGIQGEIKELPKDFSQKFILLLYKGINKSIERLGDLLLKYHNSKRKSLYANIVTSYLGYWTNNGGYYYYKTEKGMNYEDTMLAIKEYFNKNKIPIGYYNFDSWWYLKHTNKTFTTVFRPLVRIMGGGLYGNTLRWEVDPKNFTTDLKTFHQEKFKMPITAHSRRWDARSPYVEKFQFEKYKNHAVPLKKEFWQWLMKHARESGIKVYEQDWLKNQVASMPILRQNFNAQKNWLKNMATAAKENGLDVFYCMQTPGMLLFSIEHSNISISRCSEDYNHRWPLTYRFIHATQTNIFFHALGINSHPDVFRSQSSGNTKFRPFIEKYTDFNCLYQILNAGIVAPGDKKENINWTLLQKTCREDGLLLKPDKVLTANDLMFKKHRKYYICDTFTKIDNFTWIYILISNIWPKRVKETFFTFQELGFEENDYVLYNYTTKVIKRIKSNDAIEVGRLKRYEYNYYILCPITMNGMALIGCPDKFITSSGKLIINLNATKDSTNFTVEYLKNKELKLIIYSEKRPSSIQTNNMLIDSWNYDGSMKIIELIVNFGEFSKKNISIYI
ncbi:MAG: hypothetical protein ACFE9C_12980 [Candidatus Hodarchaeota archaeon]